MTTSGLHREMHFEDAICEDLATAGWLYVPADANKYDRDRALFLPDLIAWLEETQADDWQALAKAHGGAVSEVLADRIRKCLNDRERSTFSAGA